MVCPASRRACHVLSPALREKRNPGNLSSLRAALVFRCFSFALAGCILCSFSMPRLTYSKRAAIRQAVEMQNLCFAGALLLDQDLKGSENKELRARVATASGNLMKTWTALQESVRVMKGDPMPGSLKPERPKPKRKPALGAQPIWPTEKSK